MFAIQPLRLARNAIKNFNTTRALTLRPTNHPRSSSDLNSGRNLTIIHPRFASTKIEQRSDQAENVTSKSDDLITVTFLKPDGKTTTVKASQNKSLYDVVIDNDVDIDGFGACEGTLCCTTCHLIFKQEDYEKVGEPCDEALDMLDLAYGLTNTSRLGCQVMLKKEMNPLEVKVPASINDVREC